MVMSLGKGISKALAQIATKLRGWSQPIFSKAGPSTFGLTSTA